MIFWMNGTRWTRRKINSIRNWEVSWSHSIQVCVKNILIHNFLIRRKKRIWTVPSSQKRVSPISTIPACNLQFPFLCTVLSQNLRRSIVWPALSSDRWQFSANNKNNKSCWRTSSSKPTSIASLEGNTSAKKLTNGIPTKTQSKPSTSETSRRTWPSWATWTRNNGRRGSTKRKSRALIYPKIRRQY